MSSSEALDDEAVAQLLAADARAASSRYASQGLSALLPRRSNNGAPKPNTTFLKNLVRDADSHNTALARKEEEERRARLRGVHPSDHRKRTSQLDGGGDRQHGRTKKRRRSKDRVTEDKDARSGREDASSKHRLRNTSSEGSPTHSRSRTQDRHHRERHIHRNGEASADYKQHRHAHRKHHRGRTRSPSISPQRPPKAAKVDTYEQHTGGQLGRSPARSSSDPLEDIVGPLPAFKREHSPPLQSRGRGAHKLSGSVMDTHFSTAYDPSLDVHPDSEDSAERADWDMALEALRDRQQWKQKHTDRMREAGFGDDEIRKWEDSGREKSAGDLRWRKAGEGREWDAGKSVTSSEDNRGRLSRKADSDLEASWKRKSGGLLKNLKTAPS